MKTRILAFALAFLLISCAQEEVPFDLAAMRADITGEWFLWIEKDCEGVRYQNLLYSDDSRYRMTFLSDGTMIQKLQYRPDPKDTLNVLYTWDVISANTLLFRNNEWEVFSREDTTMTIRRFFETEEDPCFESVTMWRYDKNE